MLRLAGAGGVLMKWRQCAAAVVWINKNGVFPMTCCSVRKHPQTDDMRCSVLQRVEAALVFGRMALLFGGWAEDTITKLEGVQHRAMAREADSN